MWKTTLESLYTPPTFTHKQPSPVIYQSNTPNTVENVTSLPVIFKYLLKVTFIPITSFIYKDLEVSTYHQAVNDYPRITLDKINLDNSFIFEDNLYQSTNVEPLYITTTNEDIFLTIAYNVRNITSFKNIAIFTHPSELIDIYLQNDFSSPKQSITLDFLKKTPLTPESIVTFVYKYKIYDNSTQIISSILNNFTRIKRIPIALFTHNFSNYDELDLVIYKHKTYKRIYGIDTITDRGFIVNKDYITLLLN